MPAESTRAAARTSTTTPLAAVGQLRDRRAATKVRHRAALATAMHELVDVLEAGDLQRLLAVVGGTPQGRTLADAIDRYEAEYLSTPDISDSSRKWRTLACRRLREWYGARDLDGAFRDAAVDLHKRLPRTTASMTANTLSRILKLANKDWRWRTEGHDLGKLAYVVSETRERVLDLAERRKLERAFDEMLREPYGSGRRGGVQPPAVAALRLITLTGMRAGEAASLQWKHVRPGSLYLPRSKTGKRHVPLSKAAQALIAEQPRQGKYVFPGRSKRSHVSKQALLQTLKRAARLARIDVEDLVVHTLRHTWATEAMMAGVPVRLVAEALGWTTDKMARKYQHVQAGDVRAACDKVAAAIAGGAP